MTLPEDAQRRIEQARGWLTEAEHGIEVAQRRLAIMRELPGVTRADVTDAVRRVADAKTQASLLAANVDRRAMPWTRDETLERRRAWRELLREGLSPEGSLGFSAAELRHWQREHGLG